MNKYSLLYKHLQSKINYARKNKDIFDKNVKDNCK